MSVFPGLKARSSQPELPETCTLLESDVGGKVYVVGCAHFSTNSQEDVAKVIHQTLPDFVFLELDSTRTHILHMDEDALLQAASQPGMAVLRSSIQQYGAHQGIMHYFLLNLAAHCARQLGMAPGGEMRRAVKEAKTVPYCDIVLGDRPLEITMKRVLGLLSTWEKLRLCFRLWTELQEEITPDLVEELKKTDVFEEMMLKMSKSFPVVSQVLIDERDKYMTAVLQHYSKLQLRTNVGPQPVVVVAVVGMGHMPGIKKYWKDSIDAAQLSEIPPQSVVSYIIGKTVRFTSYAVVIGGVGYLGYRVGKYAWSLLGEDRPLPSLRIKVR